MKYCSKCGSELKDGTKFCSKCGTEIGASVNVNNTINNSVNVMVNKREIAISIILSLVTCGIYGIYWFVVMADDVNKVSGDNKTSGIMAFVFSLLTCGIYTVYWSYTSGKKLYEAGNKYGKDIADNSILYLILSLFGFGIINYCLIQSDLNKFA